MKGRLLPIAIGLGLTVLVLWLQFSTMPLLRQTMQRLDYMAYDLRLKATLGERAVDPRVVIVDIDEQSLKEEGHWPWPRDRIGLLIDKLFDHGAAVIAFDVVFAESERNSGRSVLKRLGESGIEHRPVAELLERHLEVFDNDVVLARHLEGRDVVLGFIFHQRRDAPIGRLPRPLAFKDAEQARRVALPSATSFTGNIPTLVESGPYGGFFSLVPDSDGIYRRAPMLQRHGDAIYPSLALETVRLFLLAERIELQTAQLASLEIVEAIKVGDRVIPTDSNTNAVVPYRGEQGSYRYLSATDVLRDRLDEGTLAGNIVLIGTTAQGLFDLRATPVQGVFPGVEVHANLISGILDSGQLDSRFPVEPSWAAGANFTVTLLVGLLLSVSLPRMSPAAMVFATAAMAVAVVGMNLGLWAESGLNLAVAPPVMLIGALAPFNIAFGFWQESRDRRRLKEMFGQYVPPQLVEEMNRNPDEDYGFKGDSREMSVLFCDIRGFTTISEQLSATQLKEMLNQFFTPMTRVIFDHRGTIDKYVGDMIMAFWGAPVEDPRHAEQAVAAALAMQQEAVKLRQTFKAAGLPEFSIGIGINSGLMNVGDMGSAYRRAYTVIGDAVNLASRLESSTKFYGVDMIIGEETYKRLGGRFVCRELDRLRVKGKATAVTVYQPLCPREALTPPLEQELARLADGLRRFRARDWQGAEEVFAALCAERPGEHLYALYLQRVGELRAKDPGEGWDGVFERRTK